MERISWQTFERWRAYFGRYGWPRDNEDYRFASLLGAWTGTEGNFSEFFRSVCPLNPQLQLSEDRKRTRIAEVEDRYLAKLKARGIGNG